MKNMKLIKKNSEYQLWEFTPSIFKLFYNDMERITLQRKIRFFIELLRGYKVYYLMVENNLVAYSVVSKGGGRYSFASKKDIVVGPYFVDEKYRGKGYSEILVKEILALDNYQYAYDWIRKDNIPSLKCSFKVGFIITDTADVVKPFRRIVVRDDNSGEYYILRYTK